MGEKSEKIVGMIRKYQYVFLILLAGILLMVWPQNTKKDAENVSGTTAHEVMAFDLVTLEQQLGETLSQIQGVGRATVVLTLADGGKRILAQDEETGERSREVSTVIVSNGSREQNAVTIEMIYPTFQGALVVCDGGNASAVRLAVVQAIEALTGLQAGQISVCARSGGS